MKEFTFLGMSESALSMFIEILHANYGEGFRVKIIRNLSNGLEGQHSYKIPGIECCVLHSRDWQYDENANFVIGVNLVETKRAVFSAFKSSSGVIADQYQTLVHPSAVVSATTELSSGVILNPGVVLAPFTMIDEIATIGRCVSIGHHSTVGAFTTIHPGVNIAGHCRIGRNVTIGMGSNIIDGVSVGDNAVIGAGSLVISDIPERVFAIGMPAKVVGAGSALPSE